jgi:hypothetical protein
MVTFETATGVHAAPVAGSVVSVRHSQPNDELSAVLVLCTVVAPLLSCTAPLRVPASDFWMNPRVVTATTLTGVAASAAMP